MTPRTKVWDFSLQLFERYLWNSACSRKCAHTHTHTHCISYSAGRIEMSFQVAVTRACPPSCLPECLQRFWRQTALVICPERGWERMVGMSMAYFGVVYDRRIKYKVPREDGWRSWKRNDWTSMRNLPLQNIIMLLQICEGNLIPNNLTLI